MYYPYLFMVRLHLFGNRSKFHTHCKICVLYIFLCIFIMNLYLSTEIFIMLRYFKSFYPFFVVFEMLQCLLARRNILDSFAHINITRSLDFYIHVNV
jgi:hypothetical protein